MIYFQHHHKHHHHHHHGSQDSGSTQSSDKSELNGSQGGSTGSHRRGSQSSQTSSNYARRDFSNVQHSLDSPQLPQRTLDLHRSLDLHRGSLDQVTSPAGALHSSHSHHHPLYMRQESFPRDNQFGYAREMSSQYPDVSQITAVQVTPRPKPRAFPRTNPAYVGVHRRNGQPTYKRINIEQHQPPTAIYNQRFYNAPPQHGIDPPSGGPSMQSSQTFFNDLSDRLALRHERSDSDTSHSSYGISRLQHDMTDSMISHGSLSAGGRQSVTSACKDTHSDSHSSQGSLRGVPDSLSSQGSLRSGHEHDHAHNSSSTTQDSSPQHVHSHCSKSPPPHKPIRVHRPNHKHSHSQRETKTTISSGTGTTGSNTSSSTQGSQKSLTRRNSEPDYANLPLIAHLRGEKIMTVDDPVTKQVCVSELFALFKSSILLSEFYD